jgi:hypothetical protein
MELSEITVRRFRKALKGDLEGIENWNDLYLEWLDKSGIAEAEELSLMIAIHNLEGRLSYIKSWVEWQRGFIKEVGQPVEQTFEDLKKYGHRVTWSGDLKEFDLQLTLIESKEKRNKAELDKLNKDLKELQMDRTAIKHETNNDAGFMKMLARLNKDGYKIIQDKTDMEELSYIVKQHSEDYNATATNLEA